MIDEFSLKLCKITYIIEENIAELKTGSIYIVYKKSLLQDAAYDTAVLLAENGMEWICIF